MKYVICLIVLMSAGCAARQPGEFDPPQHRADYAECEKEAGAKTDGLSYALTGGMGIASKINDCMKAKGY
jgi:hypothetical protein